MTERAIWLAAAAGVLFVLWGLASSPWPWLWQIGAGVAFLVLAVGGAGLQGLRRIFWQGGIVYAQRPEDRE